MLPEKMALYLKCCTVLMSINLLTLQICRMCCRLSFFRGFEQKNLSFFELEQEKKQERTAGVSFPIIQYIYRETE